MPNRYKYSDWGDRPSPWFEDFVSPDALRRLADSPQTLNYPYHQAGAFLSKCMEISGDVDECRPLIEHLRSHPESIKFAQWMLHQYELVSYMRGQAARSETRDTSKRDAIAADWREFLASPNQGPIKAFAIDLVAKYESSTRTVMRVLAQVRGESQ